MKTTWTALTDKLEDITLKDIFTRIRVLCEEIIGELSALGGRISSLNLLSIPFNQGPNYYSFENELFESFVSAGWTLAGGGTETVGAGNTTDHPGQRVLATTAVANNITVVNFPDGFLLTSVGYFGALIRTSAVSVASMGIRCGIMDGSGAAGEASEGVYFSYLSSTSGNWRAVTRGGAGITATDLGIALATTTYYFLEIKTIDGLTWDFYINGKKLASHTTNITVATMFWFFVVETLVATSKAILVDWYGIKSRLFPQRY